jgi:hypothetical protein
MIDYDIQANEVRKEANNIDVQYYSNDEINTKIELRTAKFHQDLGRSAAYDSTADPIKYKVAKLAIIKAAAADLLSTIDQYKKDGELKFAEYAEMITGFAKSGFIFVSDGYNITDELDEENYIPEASDF